MSGTSPETIRRNERVTSDLDIYRAARATIARYGDGAGLHATQRADELMAAGDGGWDELSVALQLIERPAESPAGGIGAIIFLGDLLGFLNNATGGLDHLLPCLGIGRDLLCDVAGDLAQQH